MKSSRLLLSTILALSLAALLSGCGQDTTPTGVTTLDQTAPAAPTGLCKVTAADMPSGSLAWQPSTSANVAGYEVYLFSPDPTREDSYVLSGQTDAGTTQFPLPFSYDTETLYYRVKSVSGAGVQSAWSVTVAVIIGPINSGADAPAPATDEPLTEPVRR